MVTHARVTIIGGGIAGCSLAFWLGRSGWSDVVLLEKLELASGSTWHAAGLCTQVTASADVARLHLDTLALYRELETLTGGSISYKEVGSLRVAATKPRVDELHALGGRLRYLGLPFEIVGPGRVKELWPLIDETGIIAAAHTPTDGYVDPSSVVQALAADARSKGAQIHRGRAVRSIRRLPSGDWEVQAGDLTIRSQVVVDAAGIWAREVARLVDIDLPLVPMEHEYIVTGRIAALPEGQPELPVLRDPDRTFYARQEGQGLVVGVYEHDGRPWAIRGIPEAFGQELLAPDFERIRSELIGASERIPALLEAGIKMTYNGPDAYTPDDRPLLGEVPDRPGFFVIAGFSSSGIMMGPGAARVLARWIVDGHPDRDVHELDLRRFGEYATSPGYLASRAIENYRRHYRMHPPDEEPIGARPLRTDPLYDALRARGAVFGECFGWERPLWFSPDGTEPTEEDFRIGPSHAFVREECLTVRDTVGMLDQTSFGKLMVTGPRAASFLEQVSSTRPPRIGRVGYSIWLNEEGGIEADATITRLGDDRFYVVVAAATERHDRDWLDTHAPRRGVRIETVTPAFGVLSLAGPRSRDLLAHVSDGDVSSVAMPFFSARSIEIGAAKATALRVSFTGELGYELHVPIELLRYVYDMLHEVGTAMNLRDIGYRALDSLRIEKGYRMWGPEISPDVSPGEAGLGHLVDVDRKAFIGRKAVLGQRDRGFGRRLATFYVDTDDAYPRHHEPVFLAGTDTQVGRIASGAYGHRVDSAIATALVPEHLLADPQAAFEVELLGERRPARLGPTVPYDPDNARQRA